MLIDIVINESPFRPGLPRRAASIAARRKARKGISAVRLINYFARQDRLSGTTEHVASEIREHRYCPFNLWPAIDAGNYARKYNASIAMQNSRKDIRFLGLQTED